MESVRADAVGTDHASDVLAIRGCQLDAVDPATLLADEIRRRPWTAWASPDETVAGTGSAATISVTSGDRFEAVRERASGLFANQDVATNLPPFARPRLFGGFAFHDVGVDRHADADWTGFPDAYFHLPAVSVIERDGETWLTAAAVGPDAPSTAEQTLERWQERLTNAQPSTESPPGIAARSQIPERGAWTEQVDAAVERIDRGDLRKVVLAGAQTVDLAGSLSVPAALDRLSETYPDCYRFAFAPEQAGAGTFFGATPERLLRRDGPRVQTAALAGSIGRGDTGAEDEWLAEELTDSPKDSHEHALVVEAIREQLDGFAETVTTGERTIRQLATVQHLQTPIEAILDTEVHVLSLVEALHPTPAVGGLPPDDALAAIQEAEAFDRGWYAAPIGWFDAAGDGEFAVGIRSALTRERRATLFAGAGIVADSDPDAEWDEIQLKYRPILDALR
ncbi:Menaquinone-specific isochorismate synthase [Halorhabdus sp. SVX81]|uniref:isochorismate synthase n=1 Tax=Halorhabdus sp. SVX81 TaxID=2978283 RepID=UPI0023DC250A|nr:isochorismate synthase [Halorhabdus sp. SVX81]WEL16982.1 Menaquinone-specific isochorismate synthase [Halorhabdus sp. SVX81]